MIAWTGKTTDGAYGLSIKDSAFRAIDKMCSDANKVETGGVLVGFYSSDLSDAIVVEATSPPSDSQCGISWFNRGIAGLSEMLRRRWHSNERSYYLGEWHYHPAAQVIPSDTDFQQMYAIREDFNYHCAEPILVILGKPGDNGKRSIRAFVFPRSQPPNEIVCLNVRDGFG